MLLLSCVELLVSNKMRQLMHRYGRSCFSAREAEVVFASVQHLEVMRAANSALSAVVEVLAGRRHRKAVHRLNSWRGLVLSVYFWSHRNVLSRTSET